MSSFFFHPGPPLEATQQWWFSVSGVNCNGLTKQPFPVSVMSYIYIYIASGKLNTNFHTCYWAINHFTELSQRHSCWKEVLNIREKELQCSISEFNRLIPYERIINLNCQNLTTTCTIFALVIPTSAMKQYKKLQVWDFCCKLVPQKTNSKTREVLQWANMLLE